MKKTTTTAGFLASAAVGFVAGGATMDAVIASPMPMNSSKTVAACLSSGQVTALRNILKSAVCAEFEAAFELEAGSCNADFLKSSWIYQTGDTEECSSGWRTQTKGTFPGDWQPTLP